MVWVFFAVGAVAVILIALVAVGKAVAELETERSPAVYDLNDAVEWIAQRLPDEVTARISFDDLKTLLRWHLDWFQEAGVASRHGEELATAQAQVDGAGAPHDAAIDAIVARSLAAGGPEAVDVVCVLDLQMKYLTAIGAVGNEVDEADEA
ncbi:MAG: hypothetical protein OXB92_06290 [Acidimicrobiaceae bacterium]|nr:hypothetical protein [Acidimicrobiaceae bacterium]